jgi:hypothetical protein
LAYGEGGNAMAEERITQVDSPSGSTHTTVVSEGSRGGGGTMWIIVLLLILLAGAALWLFSGMSGAEVSKDNAVAEAAGDVGNAANQVGDAAQKAADKVGN